jgi:hypothetical protein
MAVSAQALVAVKDWTFLLGPGLTAAVNALYLATVLYRARLVPRIIPTLGLIGAPILAASGLATLFGAYEQVSGPALVAALPIAIWEFSLGVWLTVKGFTSPANSAAWSPSARRRPKSPSPELDDPQSRCRRDPAAALARRAPYRSFSAACIRSTQSL